MTDKMRPAIRTLVCLAAAIPAVAMAHPGHDAGTSLTAGMLHPVTGLDHLLALLAAGMLAARMRGLAGLAVGSLFLIALAIGITSGLGGVELPFSEAIIGASVIVTALLVIRPPRSLPAATAVLAALFAFCHGVVHGLEAAGGIDRFQYAVGLMTASTLLLAVGALLGGALEARLATRRI